MNPSPQTLIVSLAVGLAVAAFAFALNRLGNRIDTRRLDGRKKPSRRAIRFDNEYLTRLAVRNQYLQGPPRWSCVYDSSRSTYELTQHGDDHVHEVHIDFFDTLTSRQTRLTPAVSIAQLPPGVSLPFALGAPARVQNYAVAIRRDDRFGINQLEKLRLKDARRK